ncbi:MAG TPA: hypothetical protein VJN69_02765 [Candidatus Acidoferrales bacterium]|nr:hypothetical protein [Candidatus Acidoferrales bacterium]
MKSICTFAFLILFLPSFALGQEPNGGMQDMPGMDQSKLENPAGNPMSRKPKTFIQEIVGHTSSGTSAEPDSTPTPMLMAMKGQWMLMFHANAFVADIQQTGARGGDKFFSANWFMPMAQRVLGGGIFTARTMLSLEPATIGNERYPLLFQQGETAYGRPIADGQHPHNLFMEIAAIYDWKVSERTLVSLYFAPVGDPAIGPTAYPHRASAAEDPLAALGHHQEDSTHISDDVMTGGLTYRSVRIEASGFHGREPGESRWGISQGGIDSWSIRATMQPGANWSGQYSYARIASPEALFPSENQERMTASAMYNRPLTRGNWANTLVWGRTRSLQEGSIFNSYLIESSLRFCRANYIWTRIESAERSSELIVGENPLPLGFQERPIGHVQAYTFGYSRDFDLIPDLASAVGVQVTTYGVPNILQPVYGTHPFGVTLFVRLRPFSSKER